MIGFSPILRNPQWKEMQMRNSTICNTTVSLPSLDEAGVPVSTLCALKRVRQIGDEIVAKWILRATLTEPFFGSVRRTARILLPGAVIVRFGKGQNHAVV